jgi:diguanylate cyclase
MRKAECLVAARTAARYGGEGFAVILPDHGLAGSLAVAERIRMAIASRRVVNRSRNQTLGTITLSIGAAQFVPGETPSAFIEHADRGLYAAKRTGRNRVVADNDIRGSESDD